MGRAPLTLSLEAPRHAADPVTLQASYSHQLSPKSALYQGDDENVILRHYGDVIVDECCENAEVQGPCSQEVSENSFSQAIARNPPPLATGQSVQKTGTSAPGPASPKPRRRRETVGVA
ncbi:hypothetical protein QTO34_006061 [Cnephaeus nilssonii]|uniref:Uncharacterized protein n=1 Tax=Cnephaeus nilssonii TaxID=3371016 RepID=A0AA40LI90_CNENI|nr:hypothetical protein QTO34_006061 [Eptesicus nilssonii]